MRRRRAVAIAAALLASASVTILLLVARVHATECFRTASLSGCTTVTRGFGETLLQHPGHALLPLVYAALLAATVWSAALALSRDRIGVHVVLATGFGILATGGAIVGIPFFLLPFLLLYACAIAARNDLLLAALVIAASILGALLVELALRAALPYWPGGLETILHAYALYGALVALAVGGVALAQGRSLPFARGALSVFATLGAAGIVASVAFALTFFRAGVFLNEGKAGAGIVLGVLLLANLVLAPVALRLMLRMPARDGVALGFAAATGAIFVGLGALLIGELEPALSG